MTNGKQRVREVLEELTNSVVDMRTLHYLDDQKLEEALDSIEEIQKEREAKLIIKARMNALEWVLIQTGRWSNDSDVGLIAYSKLPEDRIIADELIRLKAHLDQINRGRWESK